MVYVDGVEEHSDLYHQNPSFLKDRQHLPLEELGEEIDTGYSANFQSSTWNTGGIPWLFVIDINRQSVR